MSNTKEECYSQSSYNDPSGHRITPQKIPKTPTQKLPGCQIKTKLNSKINKMLKIIKDLLLVLHFQLVFPQFHSAWSSFIFSCSFNFYFLDFNF